MLILHPIGAVVIRIHGDFKCRFQFKRTFDGASIVIYKIVDMITPRMIAPRTNGSAGIAHVTAIPDLVS